MKGSLLAVAAFASALSALAATPKVMVVIDEKALGTISTSEIETMAVRMLGDNRVETVDQSMVKSNLERIQQAFRGSGDNRAASVMGREFGADVMLIGEAVSKPNAAKIADSNLRSYMASVSLRAVRVDNSVNIASASETATAIAIDDVTGSSKALKAAGEKALKAIIPSLITKWNANNDGAGRRVGIEITVGGMDQIWKLKETRERLKGMKKEIASVVQKSYAQGMAVFRVESFIPAEELAEALVINPPTDLKVQVVEIKPQTIDIRVVEAVKEDDDDDDDE
jgi:hypothetical protein